jgi:hypothetical protein
MDPEAMIHFASIESGGNPNAISSTGAIGVYQIVGGTASGLGVSNRFDVDQNIEAGIRYASQNARILKNDGIENPTTVELYLMHQLGGGGGRVVIKANRKDSDTLVSTLPKSLQGAMEKNVGRGSDTVGKYVAANEAALDANFRRNFPKLFEKEEKTTVTKEKLPVKKINEDREAKKEPPYTKQGPLVGKSKPSDSGSLAPSSSGLPQNVSMAKGNSIPVAY